VHGALGVMLALYARDARGGQGQRIDLALYEAMFNLSESLLPEYDVFGEVRRPAGGALPGITPSNAYACADGNAVLIAGNGDSIFKRLMLLIGRKDLADDPALAANDGRSLRAAELDAAIGAWTVQHAARRRARAHARRGRAREPRLHDRRDRRRRALRRARQHRAHPRDERRHDRRAGHRAQAVGHAGPGAPRRAALGQHTDDVLAQAGLSPDRIAALRKDGVIE
jgi:formyl-CoA transferase